MRIIGGNFKGKILLQPKDKKTRPLKDLTKESIFNVLNHSNKFLFSLKNSYILDLFSGVGSFGIECLSREAFHVTFVENYPNVLNLLKKNLANFKKQINYEIKNSDILENNFFKKFKNKFDLIFLDPPYAEKNINKIIDEIHKNKILNENGIIIIHRHKKDNNIFPLNFNIIEEKKYGISKIIFGKFN